MTQGRAMATSRGPGHFRARSSDNVGNASYPGAAASWADVLIAAR